MGRGESKSCQILAVYTVGLSKNSFGFTTWAQCPYGDLSMFAAGQTSDNESPTFARDSRTKVYPKTRFFPSFFGFLS